MACVYTHRNKVTDEIYYVGISNSDKKRPYSNRKNKFWINYVAKHGKPIVEIVHNGITFEEACIIEIELIKKYGRRSTGEGNLVNLSSGGDQSSLGTKKTPEQKEAIRQCVKKIMSNPERRKQTYIMVEHNRTPQARQLQRERATKQMADPERRKKQVEVLKKSLADPEASKKRHDKHKEYMNRPEVRKANSERNKILMADPVRLAKNKERTAALWQTEEYKEKMRQGWIRRKERAAKELIQNITNLLKK